MKIYKNHFMQASSMLTVMLVIVAFYGCEENDTAYEFVDSSTPSSLYSAEISGLEVAFSNESAHATNYLWDFGDGDTSSMENPVHIYDVKGEYTVALSAIDNNDSTDVFSTMYAVGFPAAGFTFESVKTEFTFTNTSSNASGYSWDFGDGSTSTEENPVHEYAEAGTYTVELTAIDGSDSDKAAMEVLATKKLVPEILSPGFDDADWATNWNSVAGQSSSKGMDGTPTTKLSAAIGDDVSQTLNVDANEPYAISVWVYVKKDSEGATATITDGEGATIVEQLLTPSEEKVFEQFTINFNTGDATSITLTMTDKTGEPAASGGAEAWIDNVTIE